MAEKKTIALSGMVTPEDVDGLPTCATLDFKDVTSVSFAGLRALLKLQEAEEGIDIVSASNEVYLLFDSTGARRFIPIMMQHYVLLQRNLIYTGVTRGKKLVILVGESRALRTAIKNNKTRKRFTRLAQRLAPVE